MVDIAATDIARQLFDLIRNQSKVYGRDSSSGFEKERSERSEKSAEAQKSARKEQAFRDKSVVYLHNMDKYLKKMSSAEISERKSMADLLVKSNSEVFKDAIKNIQEDSDRGAKRYEKLPETFKTALEKSGSEIAKEYAKNIKTQEDIIALVHAIEDKESELNRKDEKGEKYKEEISKINEKISERNEKIKNAGSEEIKKYHEKSLDDLTDELEKTKKAEEKHTKDRLKSDKKLAQEIEDLSKPLQKASRTVAEGGGKGSGILGKFGGGFLGKLLKGGLVLGLLNIVFDAGQKFIEELRAQMSRGFSLTFKEMITASSKFGMSVKDTAQFMGQNKDMMYTMNLGQKRYTDLIAEGADRMTQFTGSLSEAARQTANNIRFVRGFGNSLIDTESAVKNQENLYAEGARKFGQTMGEFDEFRKSLLGNTGIMRTVASLQEDQREGYILGIQKQQQYYRELGYTTEQTQRVTEMFAGLAAESPLERMKKGAQLGAMMGMVGMGGQGNKLQDYMKRFHTLNEEERADMMKSFTEMSDQFSSRFGNQGGIIFEQLMHQLGMQDFISTYESTTKDGRKLDKDMATAAEKRHKENLQGFDTLIKISDSIKAASESSVGLLATLVGGKIGGMFKGGAQAALSAMSRAIPGITKILPSAAMTGIGGLLEGNNAKASIHPRMIDQTISRIENLESQADTTIATIREKGKWKGLGYFKEGPEGDTALQKTLDPQLEKLETIGEQMASLNKKLVELNGLEEKAKREAEKTSNNTEKTAEGIEAQRKASEKGNKNWTMRLARAPGTAP